MTGNGSASSDTSGAFAAEFAAASNVAKGELVWLPAENDTVLPIRSRWDRPVQPAYAAAVVSGMVAAGFAGGIGLAVLVTSRLTRKVCRWATGSTTS